MSNLGQRILSAIVLGIVFLGALWFIPAIFHAVMVIILAVSLYEFLTMLVKADKISKPARLIIFGTLLTVMFGMTFAVYADFDSGFEFQPYLEYMALPVILFIVFVLGNVKIKFSNISTVTISLLWIILPFVLLPLVLNYRGVWQKEMFLGIMSISWASDIFAYFVGSSIGKHKLIERVSPNKTIEGAIGGLLGSLLVAFLIPKIFETPLSASQWMVLGGILAIVSVLGDLFESMIKRQLGTKDSGTIIPGHGGLLDRIDGLLFVIPIVAAYLYFT